MSRNFSLKPQFQINHFHVDLFGNYIPGLCSVLSVSTKDLGKPLSEDNYPVITTLFTSGIKGFYDFARKAVAYVPARSGYINKCDCARKFVPLWWLKILPGCPSVIPENFTEKKNKYLYFVLKNLIILER